MFTFPPTKEHKLMPWELANLADARLRRRGDKKKEKRRRQMTRISRRTNR